MLNLGTVRPGSTIRIPFSSFDKDDGSSITMTNYAAADILVYKDGGTTERASTSGFTATTDFDSKSGKHLAVIDLADNTTAGFFNAGSEYLVAIDAVTIDTVTTGGWIARFQIGYAGANLDTTIATLSTQTSFTLTAGPAEDDALNGHWAIIHDIASAVQRATVLILDYTGSTKTVTLVAGATFTAAAGDNISVMDVAPLQATVLGRTLDVTSTGEAGIDWANIGSPSTTQTLSGTTVKTATDVETDTQDIQARLPAALVSGRIDASVGAMAANTLTASALATDAVDEITAEVWAESARTLTAIDEDTTTLDLDATIRAAVGLASANLDTQIDALPTAAENATAVWAAGTRSLTVLDEDSTTLDLDATIRTAVGLASANLDTQLAAIDDAVDTEVGAIKATTDKLDTMLEATSDGYHFSADAIDEIPDAVWREPIANHSGVTGSTAEALNAAGAAGDPWTTALPGAYGAGSAGFIVGTNLDAALSTRATQSSVDAVDDFVDTEVAAIKGVTDKLDGMLQATSDAWQFTVDALELAPSSGGGLTASDVWAHATRTLTALDEDSTTLDIDATVRAAVGMASANLDTQLDALPTAAENATAVWAAGTRSLTVLDEDSTTVDLDATIRAAVGLAGADLDTQLAALPTAAETADAVWDEAQSGHNSSGTFGEALNDTDIRGQRTVVRATADAGASTTSIPTSAFSPAGAVADQFKGRIVVFDNDTATAALRGQATDITASTNAATPTLTVTALTTAPSSGDTFSVL